MSDKLVLEKLEKLEAELVAVLSSAKISFNEKTSEEETKKSLKQYIQKVRKAEKLFAEYETLFNKLSITSDIAKELKSGKTDSKSKTVSKEQNNASEIVEFVDPKTLVVKKKKVNANGKEL